MVAEREISAESPEYGGLVAEKDSRLDFNSEKPSRIATYTPDCPLSAGNRRQTLLG